MGKPDKVGVLSDGDTLLRDFDFGTFIAVLAEREFHWFHPLTSRRSEPARATMHKANEARNARLT